MKFFSYKQMILFILAGNTEELTASEILRECHWYQQQGYISKNSPTTGGISGMLRKMVHSGVLQYGDKKGQRGGNKYKIHG
jgi:hypothetical protein